MENWANIFEIQVTHLDLKYSISSGNRFWNSEFMGLLDPKQ